MIKLSCKIPKKVVLACSGGRDSMSALEFLIRGRRDVTVAYFNHSTEHGEEAETFLQGFCEGQGVTFKTGRYNHNNEKTKPTEASWREQRYKFLADLNETVITAHHLKDVVEWWIFSSLRGNPSLISRTREDIPVLRPFLLSLPEELHKHFGSFPYIEDPTNAETNYTRNFIRHNMISSALRVNPGLFTTIKNLYKREGK